MTEGFISSHSFLLTELRYSIQQVETQMGHLSPDQRLPAEAMVGELTEAEHRFQTQAARLLGVPQPDPATSFGSAREQTVRLLAGIDGGLPAAVCDLVHQHLDNDRRVTTDIANCRLR